MFHLFIRQTLVDSPFIDQQSGVSFAGMCSGLLDMTSLKLHLHAADVHGLSYNIKTTSCLVQSDLDLGHFIAWWMPEALFHVLCAVPV